MTRKAVAALGILLAFGFAVASACARAEDASRGSTDVPFTAGASSRHAASADNIVVALGGAIVRIAHVEIVGSGLTNADVGTLFAASDAADLEVRLRKLDAASIVVSKITGDSTEGGTSRHFVQEQLLLADVHAGRATIASGAKASLAIKDESGTVSVEIGATSAKGVDIAAIVHVASAPRASGDEPLRPLCDELVANAVTVTSSVEGSQPLSIATVRETGLKARSFKLDTVATGSGTPLAATVDDFAHAVSADLVEANALALARPPVSSSGGLKSLSLQHFALHGFGDGRVDRLELNGLEVEGNDSEPGRLALGSAVVDNLATHGATMPSLDRIDLAALAIDIPTADVGKPGSHIAITVKHAGYDAPGLVIGKLPRSAALSIEHAAFDVPPDSGAVPILVAMGYKHLDLSGESRSRYDPPARTLNLDHLAVTCVGMGSLDLELGLADVSEAVVSQDDAMQTAAAEAVRVKTIALTLRNEGLIDKAIGFKAAIDGVTVSDERRNLDQLVDTGLVGFGLQDSAKAQSIVAALRKFLADPKTLHLEIGSKTGIGLDALQQMDDPKAFIDALDIDADAD